MHRVYDFLRRHPTWVDGAWSLLVVVPSLIWIAVGPPEQQDAPRPLILLVVALSWAVMMFRRRAPQAMLLLAVGTGLLQLAADVPVNAANFAFLVIIYTAATGSVRWASRLALGGALTVPTIAELRWPSSHHMDNPGSAIFNILLITVCFALAWVLGDSLRTRRAYYAHLEERAARLEREREAQSRMAVAAERARIARELHDVVAHNVSVMVVQADGGAYVLDHAPEQTRTALETISTTGRQALTEMRRLLGVLREGDVLPASGPEPGAPTGGGRGGDYLPQPGLDQLGELIEQVRGAGMRVDFAREGTPRPLPSGVELTAYRIVQEALTNTRKHGGPRAASRVRLGYGGDELTVLVEDDGRGGASRVAGDRGPDGQGHGLIGMRERVGMVGGRLRTGPVAGGGFRVGATLPVSGSAASAVGGATAPARGTPDAGADAGADADATGEATGPATDAAPDAGPQKAEEPRTTGSATAAESVPSSARRPAADDG